MGDKVDYGIGLSLSNLFPQSGTMNWASRYKADTECEQVVPSYLSLAANNFRFLYSQERLSKPHSQVSTKYLQSELYNIQFGIMISSREVQN
jgi:hypothetical protein